MASVHFLQVFFHRMKSDSSLSLNMRATRWPASPFQASVCVCVCVKRRPFYLTCTLMSDTSHKGSGTLQNEDLISETALHPMSRGGWPWILTVCCFYVSRLKYGRIFLKSSLNILTHSLIHCLTAEVSCSTLCPWMFHCVSRSTLSIAGATKYFRFCCYLSETSLKRVVKLSFFQSSSYFNEFKHAVEPLIKMAAPCKPPENETRMQNVPRTASPPPFFVFLCTSLAKAALQSLLR